ncbi:MAG TPA: ribonuclease III [Candidatus Blautia merdavium]|uniref:Mini-ribonuclease 3 n=1 Tax=Candidatus Blautia merdavium TaxID=2838494 RepID=A0A9D2PRY2_9FIRM|nr:ribonuclease III [Candidatus Blautia merdavium]
MEKGLDRLREMFGLENTDIRTYSPLTLAYIGDGIYELIIRTILVEKGNTQVNKLHQRASRLVKASAQSQMIQTLTPHLTEEELSVFRRGRNAKSFTMAKNATMSDYRRATGFEALMGYLYLTEQWERMLELIRIGIQEGEQNGEKIPGK